MKLKNTFIAGLAFSLTMLVAVANAQADAGLIVSFGNDYGHSHRSHRHGHGYDRNQYKHGRRHWRRHHRHRRHHHRHRYSDRRTARTAISFGYRTGLSARQRRLHDGAYNDARRIPDGDTIVWNDGRTSGRVTPIRSGSTRAGRQCREFRHTVRIDGDTQRAYGTACRQPDGSWEIVN